MSIVGCLVTDRFPFIFIHRVGRVRSSYETLSKKWVILSIIVYGTQHACMNVKNKNLT